jgi:ABC-type phosphate/phosphonate transport system substrate-binding protein
MKDKFADIFEKTKILFYTDSIPNYGFAINRNIKGIERDKIIEAIKNVVKKNGDLFYKFFGSKEVISASDSDYNILRNIKDKVKQ